MLPGAECPQHWEMSEAVVHTDWLAVLCCSRSSMHLQSSFLVQESVRCWAWENKFTSVISKKRALIWIFHLFKSYFAVLCRSVIRLCNSMWFVWLSPSSPQDFCLNGSDWFVFVGWFTCQFGCLSSKKLRRLLSRRKQSWWRAELWYQGSRESDLFSGVCAGSQWVVWCGKA